MDDQPGSLPLDDRLGLAADPDTDRDTAAMLAADPDPAVRSELAVNCRHADVLKVLSHDADPNVVWELCSYNRRIPAEILLRIVAAPPLDVPAEIAVKWAAVNPGATAEVLAAVANHPAAAGPDGEELRHRVAIHPNADDDTLRIIKAQGGVTGELAEARLPDTSPARLTQLAEAAHPQAVSPTGAPPSGTPAAADPDPLAGAGFAERLQVGADQSTPPEALGALARDPHLDVRFQVAGNPSTPPMALTRLAADPNFRVRIRAAANPSTPPAVLAAMAASGSTDEVRTVAQNLSVSPETLAELAASASAVTRQLVAEHPAASPETLAELAATPIGQVRVAVALHPSTSPETLTVLAGDLSPPVRRAALENPRCPPAGRSAGGLLD